MQAAVLPRATRLGKMQSFRFIRSSLRQLHRSSSMRSMRCIYGKSPKKAERRASLTSTACSSDCNPNGELNTTNHSQESEGLEAHSSHSSTQVSTRSPPLDAVSQLIWDLHQTMCRNSDHEHQLQQLYQTCFELANERMEVGSTTSAVVAIRRMQCVRVDLGRLSVSQCRLMELYTDLQLYWEATQQDDSCTNPLTSLDVSHYRQRMTLIPEQTHALSIIERTDEELLREFEQTRAEH